MDDLADGDLPPHWRQVPRSQVMLAAATLVSTIPQLALADLEAAPSVKAAMQRRLTVGLLRTSAGQQQDYCQRAFRALDGAQPLDPAAADLRAMIREVSFSRDVWAGPQ